MKRILLIANLALLAMFCPRPSYCQPTVEAWVQRYNGPAESNERPQKAVVDSSGNVIVVGYSSAMITGDDWLVIKYSGAGAPVWTNRYNGTGMGNESANAVTVDGSGNVFVTGSSFGSGSSGDYATIAYSSAGVPLWTNLYDGPAHSFDQAYAVAVDGSGNVFVTGRSVGSSGNFDYVTIKYSGAGVALWTNSYDRGGDDQANAIAVDGSGNVSVTGYSFNNFGNRDYATINYSSVGVALWTNRYDGPGNGDDRASAVAVDSSGNLFVTGFSTGSGGDYDYATIKYS